MDTETDFYKKMVMSLTEENELLKMQIKEEIKATRYAHQRIIKLREEVDYLKQFLKI